MREEAAENWAQETAGWRGQDRAGQRALWPFTTEDRKSPRTPTICLLLPRGLGEGGEGGSRGRGGRRSLAQCWAALARTHTSRLKAASGPWLVVY